MAEEYDMENELLHFLDVENFNETNACHEIHSEQPKCIAVSLEFVLNSISIGKLIGVSMIKWKHVLKMLTLFSIVKCISEELENRKRSYLVHKVNNLINPGTVLFFLDNPNFKIVHACGGYLGNLPECKLLYEAPFDSHTLHISVVEKHLLLYGHIFGTNICNTMFKVFCRVWVKCDKILAEENAKVKMAGHRERRFLERKINQYKELQSVYKQFKNHDVVSCLPWKKVFSSVMKKRGYSERRIRKTLEEAQKDHVNLRRLGQILLKDSYKDIMEEKSKIREIERNADKQWVTNFQEHRKKTVSDLAAIDNPYLNYFNSIKNKLLKKNMKKN
ncbi:hypothetical protein CEXT_330502 [Caerostris extrusa]|uniref:Uncharacterized protein n=1 Tax=Caerostris extrusa TaxID=172846 RepID=A0AAV4RWJ3_CAEEX|nr:hypothetical protein CEXT_330502 [Caerostris extrusa]